MTILTDFDDYINDPEFIEITQAISDPDGQDKALLYVEAPFDVGCWNRILEILNVSKYFEVSTFGQNHGRKPLLALLDEGKLHKRQMIAIDADLDRLVGYKVERFESPFVFDTYVYSIEGVILNKDIIQEFVQMIINDYKVQDVDFLEFIEQYSLLCYRELSKVTNHFNNGCGEEGPDNLVEHFKMCNISDNVIKRFLRAEITDIFDLQSMVDSEFRCDILHGKGILVDNAYQYIRGHSLKGVIDCFVKNLLVMIKHRNEESIREEFKDRRGEIKSRINAFNNLHSGRYSLETYLRTASYPLEESPLAHISLKIQRTVQHHIAL